MSVVHMQEQEHAVEEAGTDSGQSVWGLCATGVRILLVTVMGWPNPSQELN